MNLVKRIVLTVLFIVWFTFALVATVYLLSYNSYSVSKIGDYYLVVADSDELGERYNEGDLIFIKRDKNSKINEGDEVFLARPGYSNERLINLGVVESKENVSSMETTFVINGVGFSSEYILGKADSTKVLHGVGTAVSIVSSRLGFLFLIIFPTLIVIVYEAMAIVEEVKRAKGA